MENIEFIITIIESILALAILAAFIFGCTKSFGLKGFVLSVSGFILLFLGIDLFEKFINYSLDNAPIFIIIFFAFVSIFLIWVTIYTIYEQIKDLNKHEKWLFIKKCLKQVLYVALLFILSALIIFGIFMLL